MALVQDSIDVAAYITKLCAEKNFFINITKLQKLLYCAYGAVLAITGERLCDDHPKAWPHGPVFSRVYKFTKKNQYDVINELLKREDQVASILDDNKKRLIDRIIEAFGKYNAGQLVEWSHSENGAWYKSTNGGKELQQEIPDQLISEYFKTIVRVRQKDSES